MEKFDQRLEDILGLLHDCLHQDSAKEALANPQYATLLEETVGNTKVLDIVVELSASKDCLTQEYIQTLKKLSVGLLGN